jgi:radical SAM superfamily enzyme YgiQ (UPF0313 family)
VPQVKRLLSEKTNLVEEVTGLGGMAFRDANGQVRELRTRRGFRPGLSRSSLKVLSLDDLPLPPRHLLTESHRRLIDAFTGSDGSLKPTAQIMAHRGCAFACNFCTERGSYNDRSPSNILDELTKLKADGYEAIFFDDSTLHSYRHLRELLSLLAEHRAELNLEFGGLTRVDSILDSAKTLPLSLFEKAGFSYFYLGVEHLDDEVLAEFCKGYKADQIERCFDALSVHGGFRIGVSLLFGASAESEASIRRTLAAVAQLEMITVVSTSIVALHPADPEIRRAGSNLRFDVSPPHSEWEWWLFEEGRWYHPPWIDINYVRRLVELIVDEDASSGGYLIPKIKRGGILQDKIGQLESHQHDTQRGSDREALACEPSKSRAR